LERHGRVIVLSGPEGSRVVLSPAYQGRVMTSSASADGPSLGWINRPFIEAGQRGTAFDNYGGEDRFWLGPEGSAFTLFFPSGAPFTFDRWQTPPALQEGTWDIAEQSPSHAVFTRALTLRNARGTTFNISVKRAVRSLDRAAVERSFGVQLPSSLRFVAYESENRIKNSGPAPWTRTTGLVSVWILGMYPPAPDARIIVPFDGAPSAELINDRYFGKVPSSRLRVLPDERVALFVADGHFRSKIGLASGRARSILGSYSASAERLTLVHYDEPPGSTGQGAPPYVNSLWNTSDDPYAGDVINAYNDGPVEPGKAALGGFYELETSSPGAELAPGAELVHTHRTLHVLGSEGALEPVAQRALGVSLARVRAEVMR
jgi:hypothetical protein